MPITIVGLGPGDPELLTHAAYELLKRAPEVRLRTRKHPTVSLLEAWGKPLESYDHLYDRHDDFDALYAEIVADLVARGKDAEVVYGVPGHPLVAEATVQALLAQKDVPVTVMPGLSGLEAVYTLIGIDPTHGLQVVDALRMESQTLNPELGVLVVQVYNRKVASQAKITLMRFFPDDHPLRLVRSASVPGAETLLTIPLHDLDRRMDIDHLTSLYLPPAPAVGVERLRQIVARLRAPDGCPWDREQTHQTLRKFLLEEAYEAVEAIDLADEGKMVEELGDVLLQVVLHAQIAEDREEWDLAEVAEAISDKLVRRHPHVFGDVAVSGSAEVLVNWDQIKAAEKAEAGEIPSSRLGQVPPMAALARAEKIMGRAAKAGFDWPDAGASAAKVREELAELDEARAGGPAEARFHELGDTLLALTNLARHLELDPEDALRQASRRFVARFEAMERLAEASGRDWEGLSLDEREALWAAAKRSR